MGDQSVATHGLAGFCAADTQHMLSRRSMAKIVVETDNPVHFRARQIQRAGDQWRGGGIHISELSLDCMQDGKQRARQVLQTLDQGLGPVRIPGLHVAHAESFTRASRRLRGLFLCAVACD